MTKYMIVVILVLCGVFYAYYYMTQKQLNDLNSFNATLKISNEQNEMSIAALRETTLQYEQRINRLQTNLERSEESLNELRKTLQSHDLTRLAIEKPGLIEPRMQGATNDLFENYFSGIGTTSN